MAEAMKKQRGSKNKMAALLKTSRTQVDCLLDPKNDITLSSLQRSRGDGGTPSFDLAGLGRGKLAIFRDDEQTYTEATDIHEHHASHGVRPEPERSRSRVRCSRRWSDCGGSTLADRR